MGGAQGDGAVMHAANGRFSRLCALRSMSRFHRVYIWVLFAYQTATLRSPCVTPPGPTPSLGPMTPSPSGPWRGPTDVSGWPLSPDFLGLLGLVRFDDTCLSWSHIPPSPNLLGLLGLVRFDHTCLSWSHTD